MEKYHASGQLGGAKGIGKEEDWEAGESVGRSLTKYSQGTGHESPWMFWWLSGLRLFLWLQEEKQKQALVVMLS